MSFREKSAWISFVLVFLVFLLWLVHMHGYVPLRPSAGGNPGLWILGVLVLFVVAEIVLHVAAALLSPADARAPRDERDTLIALRATRVGFYVLAAGAWVSVASMHIRFNALFVAEHVMTALFVAELAKLGTQIVLYRRQA
jgi:uncharacterized membrane protein